jgi:hypothetical protein
MWERTRYYFTSLQDSHGNTINTKKQVEDIEEGIISMLWIGLKIK